MIENKEQKKNSIQGKNDDCNRNKNLGHGINQDYTGNKKLVHEINHDNKEGIYNLASVK
jgi:ribosomal protein S6